MRRRVLSVGIALLLLTVGVFAQRTSKPKSLHIDLSKEKAGKESTKFLAVVGNWAIVDDGGTKALGVDGRQWLRGQPAGGLAQNARAIYGSRHEEFIDNVKAFAYFPYAVLKEVDDFQNGLLVCDSNSSRENWISAQAFCSTSN
jgi:hypothetical protein